MVGLSETLYRELEASQSGVGLSVLCPALVRTNIMGTKPGSGGKESAIDSSHAMAPQEVANQVFDAIEKRRFWILTHATHMEPFIRARCDQMIAQINPDTTSRDPDVAATAGKTMGVDSAAIKTREVPNLGRRMSQRSIKMTVRQPQVIARARVRARRWQRSPPPSGHRAQYNPQRKSFLENSRKSWTCFAPNQAPSPLRQISSLKLARPCWLVMSCTTILRKLIAITFLGAIALIPVAIVALWHRMGAIWVAGYVVGIVTVPLVGIGALRAMSAMFEEPKAVIALVIFGCTVIVVSLAAATYAFM